MANSLQLIFSSAFACMKIVTLQHKFNRGSGWTQAVIWTNEGRVCWRIYVSHSTRSERQCLTHWGRVTHICVGKLTIIGSDNGLSLGRHQAIIWTNAGISLIRTLGTNFSEILIGIRIFYSRKCTGKCRLPNGVHLSRPQCVLNPCIVIISHKCANVFPQVDYSSSPRTYNRPMKAGNAWMRIPCNNYWCIDATAPGHQYQQCWLNLSCIGTVSCRNSTVRGNSIRTWNYISIHTTQLYKGLLTEPSGACIREKTGSYLFPCLSTPKM